MPDWVVVEQKIKSDLGKVALMLLLAGITGFEPASPAFEAVVLLVSRAVSSIL